MIHSMLLWLAMFQIAPSTPFVTEELQDHLLVLLNPGTLVPYRSQGEGRSAVALDVALADFDAGPQGVARIALSFNGRRVYYVSTSGVIAWHLGEGKPSRIVATSSTIDSIQLSPSERLLAACGADELQVIDVDKELVIYKCKMPGFYAQRVGVLSWSQDSRELLINSIAGSEVLHYSLQTNTVRKLPYRSASYVGDTAYAVAGARSDDAGWSLVQLDGNLSTVREAACPEFWRLAGAPRLSPVGGRALLGVCLADSRLTWTSSQKCHNYLLDPSTGWHELVTISGFVRVFDVDGAARTVEALRARGGSEP